MDLSIKPLKTSKDKIPQRTLQEMNIIPRHPSSVLFNGCSGSGKTVLLLNLLTRPEFLKDYFHEIHLFSPTGGTDDLFEHLKIPKKNIHTTMRPKDLQKILDKREEQIDKRGIDKVKRVLLIFEDVQSSKVFMKSKPFLSAFIANRHFGVSSWLCGQSFTKTPRACRLQANNIFYFRGSGSEMKLIMDEFCPAGYSKKEFADIIDDATKDPYSFMHINMRVRDTRYRKNLDEIIDLTKGSEPV